jgi:calcineurin-like phosphoesterase family protein
MIKHMVMWKLKDFAEGANKKENAEKIKAQLEGLKSKIKEVKTLEVGFNFNDSADSYDIALYAEFDSVVDLKKYQKHPEHIKVGDYIINLRLDRKVVDYQV